MINKTWIFAWELTGRASRGNSTVHSQWAALTILNPLRLAILNGLQGAICGFSDQSHNTSMVYIKNNLC